MYETLLKHILLTKQARLTMKKTILAVFILLGATNIFGQTDKNGNPVFNSEVISEEKIDNFELTSTYYTIYNNISNKKTSVFVSEKPTLSEYLKFSRDLPSNAFIIHNGQKVLIMIMLLQKNEGEKTTLTYNVVNPNNNKSMQIPCTVFGEISEKRANELIKLNIDTTSKIIDLPNKNKGFLFNGIIYSIQSYDQLKAEILEITKQIIAGSDKKEDIKDPVEYIKKETIGGKLDFDKVLESDKRQLILFEGFAYNKKDFTIFLWGKKVKLIGIASSKKAVKLWEEIYNRVLTNPEKNALTRGYESK